MLERSGMSGHILRRWRWVVALTSVILGTPSAFAQRTQIMIDDNRAFPEKFLPRPRTGRST